MGLNDEGPILRLELVAEEVVVVARRPGAVVVLGVEEPVEQGAEPVANVGEHVANAVIVVAALSKEVILVRLRDGEPNPNSTQRQTPKRSSCSCAASSSSVSNLEMSMFAFVLDCGA